MNALITNDLNGLTDRLEPMLQGKQEFILTNEQKAVFDKATALATKSQKGSKNVLIVQGGPGTGKSVVAINLLAVLTKQNLTTQYVSKNAAPRAVYQSKLAGKFTKHHIAELFKGSGAYTQTSENAFDALIVDEAHRLNEKSGLYQNQGENQILEIIRSARLSLFFIDEDQRVTLKDIGEVQQIRHWAESQGATVHEMALTSQLRCNGSDEYLGWLDNALQMKPAARGSIEKIGYDFRVVDSPTELRDLIFEKNKLAGRARLVAGYCWDWKSKNYPTGKVMDIVLEEHDFAMRWNLASDGSLWLIKPKSVTEVGCIHTCQGLELDYVGVIIGPDLIVRDGVVITDATKRSSQDRSVQGYKTLRQESAEQAEKQVESIVKNTYRTLMTRGQKGCYVFCTDKETQEYFSKQVVGLAS
ncbi:DUF2075 domain-containing protein [Armatimonas rosea]|uniref:DUF2075 family protein n=1 Tax=Armatimonas rosea TaxID=685828 RepID=A0A7W9SQR9_ARMRO|nr:DUF2075 domain-containing protein [Armatimonas rosea]MBB6050725.1 DUF2075 family protein [Armatimonas rosea]